ncbi:HAD-IA family hydrolase [Chakrabartyella piscis]|uniref:HAD-IA family hydrolase n=1 Tax=Chakrabartyella piscis TaxID=2918914 RepID=UPI002958C232|nr:HAD-IA family hydrolase [Chakrabartyella piscis]
MSKRTENIILFDLDGTLTDSADGIIKSAQHMQEKLGMPISKAEDLRFIVGPPLLPLFQSDFGMTLEEAEHALVVYRERYSTVGLFENEVYEGIPELLQSLRQKGKRLAVATSKKQESAIRILDHFGIAEYFEVIGGDNREIGRDTKAKVIAYVLEELHADMSDVVMVGDRKYDVEGAHAIGLPCIAVEYGYGDLAEFEACGADEVVATVKDLDERF